MVEAVNTDGLRPAFMGAHSSTVPFAIQVGLCHVELRMAAEAPVGFVWGGRRRRKGEFLLGKHLSSTDAT